MVCTPPEAAADIINSQPQYYILTCTYMFSQNRLSPCIGTGQFLSSCSSQPSLLPSSRGSIQTSLGRALVCVTGGQWLCPGPGG